MVDALKRASAGNLSMLSCLTMGMRQDRKAERGPITTKLVANMLEVAGGSFCDSIDLHAQGQRILIFTVDHLMGAPLIADYFEHVVAWLVLICEVVESDHGV